ncbi:MAG: hypothetical protein IPH57_08975 [Saprospiraceae bacterium]|nr:hypothetical protein [Saprospiraceae bacterium]
MQKQIVTESIEKMSGMMGEDAAAAMAEKMDEQDYNLTIGKLFTGLGNWLGFMGNRCCNNVSNHEKKES